MKLAHILVLASLTLSGCAFGRAVRPPQPLAAVAADSAGVPRTIHVARLMEYEFQTDSTTSRVGSTEITTLREAASVKDISGELATVLKTNKLQAVGRAGTWNGEGMGPNDLWIRGSVRWADCPECEERGIPAVVLSASTILIIGGILPYPFPVRYGMKADIRLEVVNARGEIVSTTEDTMQFSYGTIFLYPLGGYSDTARERPEMLAALGHSVAQVGQ
jgi:hypothetical protein